MLLRKPMGRRPWYFDKYKYIIASLMVDPGYSLKKNLLASLQLDLARGFFYYLFGFLGTYQDATFYLNEIAT